MLGESGSGKSVTGFSIMNLIPAPPGEIVGGSVLFEGRDLLALPEAEMQTIRGNDIAMIFQEPLSALNPVYSVGEQIAETIRRHQGGTRRAARARAVEMLATVGIPEPARRARDYPHELSGGMRQRVMIAIALACRPKLLIADEPTTALDVTIQAQILDLIRRLQRETGLAVLFVTHDVGVAAEIADRIVVMYAGQVVEDAPADALLADPKMPYTQGLLKSVPTPGEDGRLPMIPGQVPDPPRPPAGCAFAPRCPHAEADCGTAPVALEDIGGRLVRCRRWRAIAGAADREAAA